MIKRLKVMPLFRIELTLSFLLFLISLSSLAQSGLQSGTPKWLPNITGQAQQNLTTPLRVNAAQTSAALTFDPIPDQRPNNSGVSIDVSGYTNADDFSSPIDFSITGGTSIGTTVNQDGTVLNLGGAGSVVVKARVKNVQGPSPYLTEWTKGVKFSGGNQHIRQVAPERLNCNAIKMLGNGEIADNNSENNKTSNDNNAKPWATAVVFKSDRYDSGSTDQYIWNQGEGIEEADDNIYLKQNSSGELYFGWGRGNDTNELALGITVNATDWYGVYITHKGGRFNASNATASNLADAFDIRVMSSADEFESLSSNLSTSANWGELKSSTGKTMAEAITDKFTIGGVPGLIALEGKRVFYGDVASMIVTTLRQNKPVPVEEEIMALIRDPKQWEIDYRIGETIRGGDNNEVIYKSGDQNQTHDNVGAVQIWLMGDGVDDSYGNGIRNQVRPDEQNYTKLFLDNIMENTIKTVDIPGLTRKTEYLEEKVTFNIIYDTDQDGVFDDVDLDDDNDGILDTYEYKGANGGAYVSSAEIGNHTGIIYDDIDEISNGITDNSEKGIVFNANGHYIVVDLNGAATTGKILSGTTLKIYVTTNSTDIKELRVAQLSSSAADLGGGTNEFIIDQNDLSETHTRESINTVESIEYTLTEDTEFLQIEMLNRVDGNFKIKEILLVVEDTDGDGIPNHLEVDSDGDGCYDVNEAGFTPSTTKLGEVKGTGYTADGKVTDSDGYNGTRAAVTNASNSTACADNDNDGIYDYLDLDDDNDGILDTVECNCDEDYINGIAQDISTTQEGPNQTDNNLMGPVGSQNYGWASLGKLRAGERLVFSNEFLTDFMLNMERNTQYAIGLKHENWTNTTTADSEHFVGTGMAINNIKDWAHSINTSPTSLHVAQDGANKWTGLRDHLGAFIEISADGTTVRSGYYKLSQPSYETDQEFAERIANNPLNEATTTYNDWHSDFKVATSNISPAITEVDIMLFGSNMHGTTHGYDLSKVNFTKLVTDKFTNLLDTDNDGTPDHLDSDSDNDGCPDTVEAGFTDIDFDGILDGTGIDADGKVTGGDGYGTPADTDSSGTADYIENTVSSCMPIITFDDIYKLEGDPDFQLDAIASKGGTINYTIETNTTGTSLYGTNNSTVLLGTEDTLTITATFVASDPTVLSITQKATLYIQKDNDNDKIGDFLDLDDDNDGILDTEECNCTDPNFFIPPYSAGGITKEGPTANQTGTNVMDAAEHGWISLDEQLSAGERLVLDNAFLENFFNTMRKASTAPDASIVAVIGLRGDNFTNTAEIHDHDTSGQFKGNHYIRLSVTRNGAAGWVIHSNGVQGNSGSVNTIAGFASACGFLEVTSDGNNIRAGMGTNGKFGIAQGDESTKTYSDWTGYKRETGDQGYSITSEDVVIGFWTYNAGDLDGDLIDWEQLTLKGPEILDTDGDGIFNHLDLDSDDDGCPDVREAGFTDNNFDGILDGTGISADGKVTGGDGYTTPKNTDNTTPADYINDAKNECIPTITFNDIYKVENADDFELQAIASNNATITYTLETNTTGTSLSGDTVTVGTEDTLIVTATVSQSGSYIETSKEITLYIQKDTDGDKIADLYDDDDDNDGILDTVECDCLSINTETGTVTGSGSGYTLEGPNNQTTPTELYNGIGYHGWMSLNEKIAPGGRLILNAAFFDQLYASMGENTYVHIGIKNNPWYDFIKSPSKYGGFQNQTYIKIYKYRNDNRLRFTLQSPTGIHTNLSGGEPVLVYQKPEAFIELSNNGMQVRLGLTYNGLHDVTTTTYDDWDADRKIQGTTNWNNRVTDPTDIMFLGRSITNSIDVGSVDWSNIKISGAELLDTDNDGIPNHLDLDSDGDGCPDAIEAAVPTVLKNSGESDTDGITDNTDNAVIDTDVDQIGDNGFANSLETALDNGIAKDAFIASNYATYALDNLTNGCGGPIITQIYRDGGNTKIEVSLAPDKTIVPNTSFNINLFENSETTDAKGEHLINLRYDQDENTEIIPVISDDNDVITISRAGNEMATWDKAHGVKANSSFVRKDQIKTPNTDYKSDEWIEFKNDDLKTDFNNFERHPEDPLFSEITANSNAKQGVHVFGAVETENCNEDGACAWTNGAPDRSRTVIINENYVHRGTQLNADKLVIKAGKRLSIDDELLVVSDSLNIGSNAEIRLLGTSQLIQTHKDTSKVTGDGNIYIDQNSNIESVYRYNYMSSPVNTNAAKTTYTIAGAFKDGTTPLNATDAIGETIAKDLNFTGNWDGKIENGSPYISTRWIYTFEPDEGHISNWIRQGKNGEINVTDGFIFKGPGVAQNYTFAGSPNDGELETAVGKNQSYLLGNPFSSALNGLKFLHDNRNSIVGTLYFWDHVGEKDPTRGHYTDSYIGGYSTINLSTSVATYQTYEYTPEQDNSDADAVAVLRKFKTPGTYIPVGQGFYVVGKDDIVGTNVRTIAFNNSQREFVGEVHKDSLQGGDDNSIFFKSGKKKEKNSTANGRYYGSLPIVKLGMNALNQNDGKIYHRQIGVSFHENNSFAYDNGYDSEMFDTRATDFYWKFPEDERNYVIAGVQAFSQDIEVPLEIVVENTTDISIMIDDLKNIDSNIYLIDRTTGISHEITEDNANLSLEPGSYTDRFALAFKASAALSLDHEIINISTNIYVDNKNHHLIVTKDYDVDIKKIELYNVLGKTISTWKINEHAESYLLELKPGLPAGVYVSKITTNKGTNNKKIIVE